MIRVVGGDYLYLISGKTTHPGDMVDTIRLRIARMHSPEGEIAFAMPPDWATIDVLNELWRCYQQRCLTFEEKREEAPPREGNRGASPYVPVWANTSTSGAQFSDLAREYIERLRADERPTVGIRVNSVILDDAVRDPPE